MFDKHFRMLMDTYYHKKILEEGDKKMLIKLLIDHDALMSQRGLFKACMKSSSRFTMLPLYNVNPLKKVWHRLDINLTQNFDEFLKLAEMAVVHVIGSLEDEQTFYSVGF